MHSLPTSCIAGMYIVSLLHLGHHTSAVGAASQMIFRELAPCCSPAGKEMTKEGTGSRATAGRTEQPIFSSAARQPHGIQCKGFNGMWNRPVGQTGFGHFVNHKIGPPGMSHIEFDFPRKQMSCSGITHDSIQREANHTDSYPPRNQKYPDTDFHPDGYQLKLPQRKPLQLTAALAASFGTLCVPGAGLHPHHLRRAARRLGAARSPLVAQPPHEGLHLPHRYVGRADVARTQAALHALQKILTGVLVELKCLPHALQRLAPCGLRAGSGGPMPQPRAASAHAGPARAPLRAGARRRGTCHGCCRRAPCQLPRTVAPHAVVATLKRQRADADAHVFCAVGQSRAPCRARR
eukprot:365055-Chlamydomonas_euryale.AAC.5